ncbi:UNKNOWN [Stylonychia lemnae]|uniref:Uncharacterized protein n=1 Tax=Stylonychia lemnae TaxID=5949 RepID=A0A078B0W9_STYLE|nr:UNKNOWN [Stylonychia lemnae]|eukprot:CDW86997.1 UNKNOWN [Stylonychia lemnae]
MSVSSSQKQQKPRGAGTSGRKPGDFDDSRSDVSYISSQNSYMGQGVTYQNQNINQSNLSSALKQAPVFQNHSQSQSDLSSSMSHISYEDGFQNAEYNAITEEERAKRRRDEKEQKLREFQNKTKQKAAKQLQEQQKTQKQAELEAQMKEKERLIKAKDYAEKIRKNTLKKSNQNNSNISNIQILSEDPAGAHTNYHAQIKQEQINRGNNDLSEVIQEVSEVDEQERSRLLLNQINSRSQAILQTQAALDQQQILDLRELYQRIDQEELEKIGVADKQTLTEEAIHDLHEYSMLQRFRQNRDFRQPDRYVAQQKTTKQANYYSSQADKENKWWLQQQNGITEQELKQKTEKTRYLKALKALVKEKGEKLDGGEIPNLCSCGALGENLQSMKKGAAKTLVQMCASNCQFYKNEKDYEKALKDILHSLSLFK